MAEPIPGCEASAPHQTQHAARVHSTTYSRTPVSELPVSSLPSTQARNTSEIPLSTLESILAALSIDSGRDPMFRCLAAVFRKVIAQEDCINLPQEDLQIFGEALRRGDASESHGIRDIETLELTRLVLEQMLQKHSMYMVDAAEILARASRNPAWRGPFGETGMVGFFLRVLGTRNARKPLLEYALRLVGNTCADHDINRQRVVECKGIEPIMRHLDDDELVGVAIPVLYNICVDFEPAQDMALENGLYSRLLKVLAVHIGMPNPVLSYLCRLLDLFTSTVDVDTSPDEAVEVLFQQALIQDLDIDDSSLLVCAAATHLKAEQYQRRLSGMDTLNLLLVWIYQSYSLQQNEEVIQGNEVDVDLSALRAMIILSLADISALPTFTAKFSSLNSPVIDNLVNWLAAPQAQLRSCSCIMLGNLARSDAVCQIMVSSRDLHLDLLRLLQNYSDTETLHAAFGFLQNLALLNENRVIMGKAGSIHATARFWTTTTAPQIAQSALRFTRRITSGCLSNITELMTSITPDTESPAYLRTYLSILLRFFNESDDIAVRAEIARIVVAILRTIYSSDVSTSPSQREAILNRLYSLHLNIAEPLGMMVMQTQWPSLRSEGWFAMALMARSKEGSLAVGSVLQKADVFGALQAAVYSQSPPTLQQSSGDVQSGLEMEKQLEETKGKNQDNARILVSELLKHESSETRSPFGTMLDCLLQSTS